MAKTKDWQSYQYLVETDGEKTGKDKSFKKLYQLTLSDFQQIRNT